MGDMGDDILKSFGKWVFFIMAAVIIVAAIILLT